VSAVAPRRLALWYAGVLLAILVVMSALSYSFLRWSLLQQWTPSLASGRRSSARPTSAAPATPRWSAPFASCSAWLLRPLLSFLDPEGRSRFRSGPPPWPFL